LWALNVHKEYDSVKKEEITLLVERDNVLHVENTRKVGIVR